MNDVKQVYDNCGITFATYQQIESGGGTRVVCRLCAKGNGEPHAKDCGVGIFEAAMIAGETPAPPKEER